MIVGEKDIQEKVNANEILTNCDVMRLRLRGRCFPEKVVRKGFSTEVIYNLCPEG